jgi:hypothetical protein
MGDDSCRGISSWLTEEERNQYVAEEIAKEQESLSNVEIR